MKKGFTLVELSIVLVIVGLLIGGILVAQSLIDSAKIQQQVRQLTHLEIAYFGFKDRYKQQPGDSDLFTPAGDNDGIIENDRSANLAGVIPITPYEETGNFWLHMLDGGTLDGDPNNSQQFYIASGVTWPVPVSVLHDTTAIQLLQLTAYNNRKFFIFLGTATSAGTTAAEALALDIKIDGDGIGYGLGVVYNPFTSCAGSGGPTSGPYNLDLEGIVCSPAVEVGALLGRKDN